MIILEMERKNGEHYDFLLALESERDHIWVSDALENGVCMIVDDSGPIQVCIDGLLTMERLLLGVVLKAFIAFDNAEGEEAKNIVPTQEYLLRQFTSDALNVFARFDGEQPREDCDREVEAMWPIFEPHFINLLDREWIVEAEDAKFPDQTFYIINEMLLEDIVRLQTPLL
ncbi:MAG: hypothetical protein Q4A21_00140 [bacterium]|nr:hypothetical protein [bacterium]